MKEKKGVRNQADRITALARTLDPDPWRNALRDALSFPVRAERTRAVLRLAAAPDVAAQPSPTIALLAAALREAGEPGEAIRLLEPARFRYRDVWIYQELGLSLRRRATSPRRGRAAGVHRRDDAPAGDGLRAGESLERDRSDGRGHLRAGGSGPPSTRGVELLLVGADDVRGGTHHRLCGNVQTCRSIKSESREQRNGRLRNAQAAWPVPDRALGTWPALSESSARQSALSRILPPPMATSARPWVTRVTRPAPSRSSARRSALSRILPPTGSTSVWVYLARRIWPAPRRRSARRFGSSPTSRVAMTPSAPYCTGRVIKPAP